MTIPRFRIGHGYDVHAFEAGKSLYLGGVLIDYPKGLKAHSDGDVVIHAVCDALLGAASLGDIGEHFPDHDPQLKLINSRILLKKVGTLLNEHNWLVNNIDVTIVAEEPKIKPYKAAMQQNLSDDLEIDESQINIKATTNEKMGFIGSVEGIAVFAVVLIRDYL
jgi:2-C-methyl-D-erythritol 2,4-cyclodiphosphate synthase